MRILVAPDKFKGSLSAKEVAECVSRGIRRVVAGARVELLPLADGGEGTVETLVDLAGGEKRASAVAGPLGRPVEAAWGVVRWGDGLKTAIIEMSAASGLRLVEGSNRPLEATTYGTGELIRHALDAGCRRIVIGLGGSATTDGGLGAARALGARFLDDRGRELPPGGGSLVSLSRIDLSRLDDRLSQVEMLAACDVDNPLYGPAGAASVYGPQKGATPSEVERLEAGLRRLAEVIKTDLGIDLGGEPGTGAAGGLGAGLAAFAGAKLVPGFDLISRAVGLSDRLEQADLVITAEGRIDSQTARGKLPVGLAKAAKEHGRPVIALAGSIGPGADEVYRLGVDAVIPICAEPMSLEEAMKNAAELVEEASARLMRLLLIKCKWGRS